MAEDGKMNGQMEKDINGQYQTFKTVSIISNVDKFNKFDLNV